MPDEPTKPTASRPKGTTVSRPGLFLVKSAVLLALALLFYWIGWRSPWARADETVRVDVLDPPKPAPIVAPAPVLSSQDGVGKSLKESTEDDGSAVSSAAASDDRKPDNHPRSRRGKRAHHASTEADQPLD